MNFAKYLPAALSLCALFGFAIVAEGCGGNVVVCEDCECDPDGCSTSTTTETGTGTSPNTATGPSTSTSVPPSPHEVCQLICDCVGCGQDDVQDCVQSFSDLQQQAVETGCEQELNTAYACYEGTLTCENGLDFTECEPLIEAFNECMDVPPNVGPCQPLLNEVIAKYESCGIEVEVNGFECTGQNFAQLECMTPCILEAPCGVFMGGASDEEMVAFAECTEPCQ